MLTDVADPVVAVLGSRPRSAVPGYVDRFGEPVEAPVGPPGRLTPVRPGRR